jgi:hypothetical protein
MGRSHLIHDTNFTLGNRRIFDRLNLTDRILDGANFLVSTHFGPVVDCDFKSDDPIFFALFRLFDASNDPILLAAGSIGTPIDRRMSEYDDRLNVSTHSLHNIVSCIV